MFILQISYHDCTLNEKICMKLYNPIKTLKNINLYLKKRIIIWQNIKSMDHIDCIDLQPLPVQNSS